MNLATVGTHVSKYFEPTLYKTTLDNLNIVASKNNNPHGRKNYVTPFVECLKQILRYIDDRISCQKINKLATQKATKNNNPRSSNYNTTVSPQTKCLVCNGNHRNLLHCKQLLTFIPGKNFKTLPKNVCSICLLSDGSQKFPTCHKKNPNFECKTTKKTF